MKTIILTSRPIQSRHSGYDLRVANLCAHLPGEVHLVVAPLVAAADPRLSIAADEIFDSIEELPPLLAGRLSVRRHLRLSDDHFLQRAMPAAFAAARDRLRAVVRERDVTHVVVFGGELAELAATLDHPGVVLDVCDSRSLTARRALEWSAHPPTGLHRWRRRLALHRMRASEARFPERFGHVTTISEPDSREILELHGPATNVHSIPNGVAESFLAPLPSPGARRGVAFWGNLGFAPNAEALWFFVRQVYLPVLRDADVELCVVGADAPGWLTELAASEPRIALTGFVEDLRAAVTPYPIMINPMCTGSGMKNKVLEAFGLGLAVVSTPLGVEAVPAARDGIHFVGAADPAALGSAVLDLLADEPHRRTIRGQANALLHELYPWDVVGRNWQSLFGCDQTAIG
ncbi:MAG: glycosyltransferase [Pseudonocardiaceae bacterium]|nr:glycosyltransferase [Pseudonocardiaceae bacterium]